MNIDYSSTSIIYALSYVPILHMYIMCIQISPAEDLSPDEAPHEAAQRAAAQAMLELGL